MSQQTFVANLIQTFLRDFVSGCLCAMWRQVLQVLMRWWCVFG